MNDTTSGLKVLVVSHHPLVFQSIVRVLAASRRLEVVGTCFEALQPAAVDSVGILLCVLEPDFLPEDVRFSLNSVREKNRQIPLACFCLSSDDAVMAAAINAGATGLIDETLLNGDLDSERLADSLIRISRGEFIMSSVVAMRLARLHGAHDEVDGALISQKHLTPREQEVLGLLAEGRSNRDIATYLSLSEHTIRSHVRGVMQKLQVSSRIQAAASVWRGRPTTN
jgi:DNA-binding NarL/FixJ family response regulator